MLKEFVEKILDLAKNETHLFDGVPYTTRKLTRVQPLLATPIQVTGLLGLCEYLEKNRDELVVDKMSLFIESETRVHLAGALDKVEKERDRYAQAKFEEGDFEFGYGQFTDPETFMINLRTKFVDTPALREVVAVVGNMRDEKTLSCEDDGFTQSVGVKAGVQLVSKAKLPNPVVLRPFRTFQDIEQPESPFILRVKRGREGEPPLCALFEADSGMWKLKAIESIRKFLGERVKIPVIG